MKKKLLLFLVLSIISLNSIFAQGRKITGRVTGADDGQPLPGVSVKIQGSDRGTQTDADGKFSIAGANGEKLVFTFIGYTTQIRVIDGSANYSIKLISDTRVLTEVVVTDGYVTQAKKAYTGSATSVNGRENENKPYTTPLQALQGEVAGLNISSNSGQPGANMQVRIRGIGSIAADSNPLYVVDGMLINSGDLSRLTTTTNVLAGINQNDIESITVLKDASATAIYGSRGSNGVIVITTKKGKSGKTQIRFDTEIGSTSNLSIPDAGKPATADQYRTLFLEGLNNYNQIPANAKTQFDIPQTTTSYGLNGRSNDWYDLVTKNGAQQQYNVSLNGGNEVTRIFASSGYFKQEATTIGSNLKRITGLLNIDHTINKRFSVGIGLNFSNVNQNTPANGGGFVNPILSAYFLRPFQLAYNDDGSLNSSRIGNTNFPSVYNPLYMAQNDKRSSSQTRVLGNVNLKWNIWDQLKYTSYVSVDYNVLEERQYNNPIMGDGRTSGGRGYDYYTRYFNWLTRNQLSYRWDVPNITDFYVDVTAGYEAQKSSAYLISTNTNLFPATQPLLTNSINGSTPILGNANTSNYTYDAIFAIASINYKNRYVLSGSFRRDGSSRFGSNNVYGSFPSVGASWNIDQESFFGVQKIFSSAKLRVSYGLTGNSAGLSNYGWRPSAGYGINYAGAPGQNFNNIGNVNLGWEKAKQLDIGVDFGFFNDRLAFTVDYYSKNIDKLILQNPTSLTTGFSAITENIGAMTNKGFEFAVKGVPVKLKDFTWSTSFNLSLNRNKVTNLINHAPFINGNFQVQEGKPFYTWYARQYAGVDPANGDALWYTDATKTATTNDYSKAQRVAAKQADPKAFGGFNNTFSYKGITLSADFYYNYGNYIQDGWAQYLNDGTQYTFNKYASNMNRWTTPGQKTDVPKYVAGGVNNGQSASFSDRFLYKGDYIRLKNLTIGYDFKDLAFLKKLGISKLYLYGRGTNLWTKTYDKRLPFDPEVGALVNNSATNQILYGVSNLEVPQVKTYTIGLNVGL